MLKTIRRLRVVDGFAAGAVRSERVRWRTRTAVEWSLDSGRRDHVCSSPRAGVRVRASGGSVTNRFKVVRGKGWAAAVAAAAALSEPAAVSMLENPLIAHGDFPRARILHARE